MAIGDDALAAGYTPAPGTVLANTIDTELARLADWVAQRTSAVLAVAKGGTGATAAPAARANLGAPEAGTAGGKAVMDITGAGDIGLRWGGARFVGRVGGTEVELANFGDAVAASSAASAAQGTANTANSAASAAQGTANTAKDGLLNASVYSRVLSSSYRVCYVAADGTLGWVSSSRSAKEDITPASIDPQVILAMQVVTYRRIGAPEGLIEHGLIAEDLHALGLTWLVDYGPEGDTPQGVRYDLLALALLPAMQDLSARLDTIERTMRKAS